MTDPIRDLLPVQEWGIRRASGGITASSREWAEDVHDIAGLPIVHWNGTVWEDV